MAQLKGDPGGLHAVHGGPPWTDAPEVAAPGALEPAPSAASAAPEQSHDEAERPVRSGRHRRTRRKAAGRKAAGGQHSR
jgi:hypothetical protein